MAIVTTASLTPAARFRYASTLYQPITNADTTIIVSSTNDLQGLASAGGSVTASPLSVVLGAESFVRVMQYETSVATSCVPSAKRIKVEIMQVTSITANPNGTLTLGVQRAVQGNQNFAPDAELTASTSVVNGSNPLDGTGVYVQGASDYEFEHDNAGAPSAFAFDGGAVVENLNFTALLRDSNGTTADDEEYALDVYRGDVRFLKTGATTLGGRQLYDGMKVNSLFGYKTASSKRVNLGRFIPILEFAVDLQHRFPDGRYFKFHGHRCAVTPENPQLEFQPTDWIGAELQIDVLQSSNVAHQADPYGNITIDNDPITLQPVSTVPETYSAGVYELYLTPTNATRAIAQGLPTTRFSIGNVRTGSINAPQEFLEHYVGIPQTQDAKIRLKFQMQITTTIESLTADNIALLFNGAVEDMSLGVAPAFTLLTVASSAGLPAGYSLPNVSHPLNYIMLDAS